MENSDMLRIKRRRTSLILLVLLLLALAGCFFAIRALLWNRRGGEAELLSVVSTANPLGESYEPNMREVRGVSVDERCAEQLANMLADCESAGGKPLLTVGYVSRAEQQESYDRRIRWYTNNGGSEENAAALALKDVFYPGTDEHELGLAVDIVDGDYRTADIRQSETGTQRWLKENCHKYGFVLRYGEGKEALTGRAYSPWHYRYVGAEAAEQIYNLDLSLEEYLMWFYSEEAIIIYS